MDTLGTVITELLHRVGDESGEIVAAWTLSVDWIGGTRQLSYLRTETLEGLIDRPVVSASDLPT